MPTHDDASPTYPFTAVVGPGDMALALLLTAVSPEIGGVLVRGEKGTAKSTIVRALASVIPPLPTPDGEPAQPVRLVELPVGATEDRVLGSLHLEKALADGVAEYEPGLLVKAHRGILYVDEVNLLHDHLVDVLLDAAAMGRCTVERDGVSVSHPARFVLVGTMNPEEGELRPQLLDRFGLTVEVAAPRDPAVRVDVVRRRMAFDADPAAFVASYAADEQALTARLAAARTAVADVRLPDAMLLKIAEVCAAFEVDGLRADIVTARAAAAHAAWHGRTTVTLADVRAAAILALPHRRRRNPFDAPGLDEDLLDRLLGEPEPDPEPEPVPEPDPEPDPEPGREVTNPDDSADSAGSTGVPEDPGTAGPTDAAEDRDEPGEAADQTDPANPGDQGGQSPDTLATVGAGTPYRARLFAVSGTGRGEAGRRSRALTETGRRVGAHPGSRGPVHLIETIRAAAPQQAARGRTGRGRVLLRPEDLRVADREGRESNLILFCVDASGSMAARRRMEQVKTAVLSLLLDAYRRRDKVALVTFRGRTADLALPPTGSVDVAARRLEGLPAGGRTPLAEGLTAAARVVELERIRDPRRRALLVVVTDGRATAGTDPLARAAHAARGLAAAGVASLVIDCETGPMRLGLARRLAQDLRAEHVAIGEVTAEALTTAVRAA